MNSILKCPTCGRDDQPLELSATNPEVFSASTPDTGMEALLNSNQLPSPSTQSQLKSMHTDAANEIENLEAEIARIQSKLALLQGRLSRRKKDVEDYATVLSPARRIPSDLLSEIFRWCTAHDFESDRSGSSLDPTEMHWILPQVSRQWRSAALSCPQIWSTIRITDVEFGDYSAPRLLSLTLQLQRTRFSPLSVSIESKYSSISGTKPILQVLLPSSSRWKELYVRLQPAAFRALSPLHLFLPSLKYVHIWPSGSASILDGYQAAAASHAMSTIFRVCPSLRILEGAPNIISLFSLPWNQIQTYECFQCAGVSQYLKLLSLMSDLRECRIWCDYGSPLNGNNDIVVLRHLKHLSLYEVGSTTNPILDCLTLPYLQTLDIDLNTLEQSRIEVEINSLLRFLTRSQCSLETLHLASCWMRDIDCLRILQALPSLKTLNLVCELSVYTSDFMDRFVELPHTLVPLLQVLKFHEVPYDAVDVSRLKEARPGLTLVQVIQD